MGREMEQFWDELSRKVNTGTASADSVRQFKRLNKTLKQLAVDPHYRGLHSHKIAVLSKREGRDIWESYLQNHASSAERLFWTYGPDANSITVVGLEPHPSDKSAYQRVKLSKI